MMSLFLMTIFDRMPGVSCGIALESIWSNRLRSLLTSLGMIIGVMAVIVAVTLTQGAGALLNESIVALGTNTLFIDPDPGHATKLSQDDARALGSIGHVQNISPLLTITTQVVASEHSWNTRVQGVEPALQQIQGWHVARGNWFSAEEAVQGAPVAVLGETVAAHLFGGTRRDPSGQTILIHDQVFRVVGVVQAKGALGVFNQDDTLFVPLAAATLRLKNTPFVDQIQVQVDSVAYVPVVQPLIKAALRRSHRLLPGQSDPFQIRSSYQLVQTAQQFAQIFTLLLVGIAAISLTVGGIGIMNIMLVSVTERTREIGIRIAIGAQPSDIRNQFLIEALILSMLGGLLGSVLGLSGGYLLTASLRLPFVVDVFSTLLAFVVAAAIGIASGLYPALRAARLDPIVALRTG